MPARQGGSPAAAPHNHAQPALGAGQAEQVGLDSRELQLREAEADRIESLGRLISAASRRIEQERIDPELLEDVGMSAVQFSRFVEKYEQSLAGLSDDAERADLPAGMMMQISGKSTLSVEAAEKLDVGDLEGLESLDPQQRRKLLEAQSRRVAPEYRRAVSDYFRFVSERDNVPKTEGK